MGDLKKAETDVLDNCFLNAGRAAEYLGIKPFTIGQWARQGRIAHFKAGRLLRFKKADLDTFMKKEFVPSREVGL